MPRNTEDTIRELEIEKAAMELLQTVCSAVGCDLPANKGEIVMFIAEDVMETADPENWNDSDLAIGFRRWMEKDDES